MFIYHFNRIIRNRILWGFFLIIVVVAFVSVDSCVRGDQGRAPAGKLGKRPLPLSTYQTMENYVRGFGRNRDNQMSQSAVFTQSWERAAAMAVAPKLGALTTEAEIWQSLQGVPAFQEQGVFNDLRFQSVVQEMFGLTPRQFKDFFAHQITISKLAQIVDTAAWISPLEIADELAGWTDQLTIQYAMVSNQYLNMKMAVSEPQIQQYYDKNRDSFALPDRVAVRYVTLPITNFLDSVEVSDADILDYYENNSESFKYVSTNNVTETKPLAEVREEIVTALQMDEARYAASTNATFAFVDEILKAEPDGLTKIAAAKNLEIYATPLFGGNDHIQGVDTLVEFRNTAFELDPNRPDSRYGVVAGDKVIYVITPYTNDSARIPGLAEVVDQVRPLVEHEAQNEAFKNYFSDLRNDVIGTLKDGKSFSFAAEKRALNVSTVLTFTAYSMQRNAFEHAFEIAISAMPLKRGELSEGTPMQSGGMLLTYMADRATGTELDRSMMRDSVRTSLARQQEGVLFNDWLSWNLHKIGFTPNPAIIPRPEIFYEGED